MSGCSYTPDEIDHMPMQDVLSLLSVWREVPPAQDILAAVHRVVPQAPRQPDDPSGIGALIARHPAGRVAIGD